jgi:hypothetical protein
LHPTSKILGKLIEVGKKEEKEKEKQHNTL